VHDSRAFNWALRLMKKTNKLRAGKFALPAGASNYRIIKELIEGPQIYSKVTIPEGVTSRRIAHILKSNLELDSTKLISLVRDSSLIRKMQLDVRHLEGYLFPETYLFPFGLTENQAISMLCQQFKRAVYDTIDNRLRKWDFPSMK